MNPYYNLPPEQRATQQLVDQFNADERLWRKLEPEPPPPEIGFHVKEDALPYRIKRKAKSIW